MTSTDSRTARFPFPFPRDQYRYSTNVEPAGNPTDTVAGSWGDTRIAIDDHYHRELAERERILTADPSRHQCLPHMVPAAWDAMLTLMRTLAGEYPDTMTLERRGDTWFWRNDLLGIAHSFVFGDLTTLPAPPLVYICGQIQEDVVLLDQREGALWGDAGLVTFAADWSFGFDVGMSFLEIHGPVPRIHTEKIITRAHNFLMRLEPGQSYRRTNWTLTVDGTLDTSTETYPEWGKDRRTLADGPLDEVGDRLFLRTEVQHLIRLAHSGAVMFLIRTYLLPLRDVASVTEWGARLYKVLEDLPVDMAEYKGISRTREPGMRWLAAHGDVEL
ncbi:heme-dependent oxidative N-demethylase family protein [Rhodococcus koreensis]